MLIFPVCISFWASRCVCLRVCSYVNYMCIQVHMQYVCICDIMCVFVKMYAHGRREDGFDFPPCIWGTRSFTALKAAGEADQQTLGILFSQPPQHQNYKHFPPHFCFLTRFWVLNADPPTEPFPQPKHFFLLFYYLLLQNTSTLEGVPCTCYLNEFSLEA